MTTEKMINDYMTVTEIKEYLNISQASAYRLVNREDFPVVRLGRAIHVPRELFLLWVERMTHVPAGLAV